MADEATPQAVVPTAEADATVVSEARPDNSEPDTKNSVPEKEAEAGVTKLEPSDKQSPPADGASEDKHLDKQEDTTMEDTKPDDASSAVEAPAASADDAQTPAQGDKSKARRKSGVPEHKKKLNKKASKKQLDRMDNQGAKPGDYFYVRLKGFPLWPAIVCDEPMLPTTLLKTRPVSAANAEGVYRDDYADGGSKAKDRSFPVMYLHTNEFGWIPNYDLMPLDFDTVGDTPGHMRKDLKEAHHLAAERHDLDYFKDILEQFMKQKQEQLQAKEDAKAAKKAEKSSKAKPRKSLSKATVDDDENEDVDMEDAADPDSEEGADKTKKTKKRKAEEDVDTPSSESVKKPKTTIKLTNTPKATNGSATPKSAKEPKSAKPKVKKATAKAKEPEVETPKEPELTAEEKRAKKEKEILFLRHKLQKGLLTRDQEPKEEEMAGMSEFITKLEGYSDLEVSIIRATKINKVLKAILKLATIPKEAEFKFKTRSQTLLDKWNKLLLGDAAPASGAAEPTNGEAAKVEATNGNKDDAKTEDVSDKEEKTETTATVQESNEGPVPVETTA